VHESDGRVASTLPVVVPDAPILLVGSQPWWEAPDGAGLSDSLAAHDWAWLTANDDSRARWLVSVRRISLVVVDGTRSERLTAVESIRRLSSVPIVAMADDDADVRKLLTVGADAVIPVGEEGITSLARLDALLRRSDHRRGVGARFLRADDLVVDLWSQECARGDEPLSLSPTEFDLLAFLMTRPSVTVASETIVRRVWEFPPADHRNALRIVVNRLRRKLGDDASEPRFIAAIRGSGYRFVERVTEVADSMGDGADHVDIAPMLQSFTGFVERLAACPDASTASTEFVEFIAMAGLADGVALFRTEGDVMRLMASSNMPELWLSDVRRGVPLDPSFASAHSVLSGEVVQFSDVRTMSDQYSSTASELAVHGFRACHFVPISMGDEAWGHIGLARTSPSPLDDTTMTYLRSLCATFLLRTLSLEHVTYLDKANDTSI